MNSLKQLKSAPAIRIITHDVNVALFADYAYGMKDGRLVTEGPPREIVQAEIQSRPSKQFSEVGIEFNAATA